MAGRGGRCQVKVFWVDRLEDGKQIGTNLGRILFYQVVLVEDHQAKTKRRRCVSNGLRDLHSPTLLSEKEDLKYYNLLCLSLDLHL